MNVRDVMTTPAITVGPDASCKEIVRAFIAHDISGLPVVDGDGRLIGMVSETDLVAEAAAGVERHQRSEARRHTHSMVAAMPGNASPAPDDARSSLQVWKTAGEMMTRNPPSATLDEGIDIAACRMLHARCDHLPVVRNGIVVGIVSRKDIIRAFDDNG